jgi:hypothetical protein
VYNIDERHTQCLHAAAMRREGRNLCLLTDFYRKRKYSLRGSRAQTRKEAHTNYKLDLIIPTNKEGNGAENNNIAQCAKKYGADIVSFGPAGSLKLQCCKCNCEKKSEKRAIKMVNFAIILINDSHLFDASCSSLLENCCYNFKFNPHQPSCTEAHMAFKANHTQLLYIELNLSPPQVTTASSHT